MEGTIPAAATVSFDELVSGFSESVGYERAESVVAESAESVGVDACDEYDIRTAETICECIESSYDNPLGVVASTLRNQLRLRRIESDETADGSQRVDIASLFTRTGDAVAEVEFEAGTPVVRRTNPSFGETFGLGVEAAGESLVELGVPPANDRLETLISRVHDGDDIDVEVEHDDRDFRLRGVGLLRDGTVDRAYFAYTDITERKARERDLRRQNEHLDAFASVVSHDLRNPLSIAKGYLELSREEGEVPYGEEIAEAHERIDHIIGEMLALARHGRTIEEPSPVYVGRTAQSAWSNVATDAATLELESGTERRIHSDRERLLHLFENLFRNSVEHGTPGAAPASDAKVADLTVRVGLDDGRLYVADDGPGVSLERREEVFEAGTTESDDGTGLGLFIVKQVAEAHDWRVELAESADGGARFEFHGVERVD